MSFGVQIPLSNTLRMVRTDNQGSNLQNFDNRLLHQEDYIGYYAIPYSQKISSSDNILVQYSTDYTTVTAKIYDINDDLVSDKTSNISEILSSTTFNYYDLLFTIATEGFYYLILDFDSGTEIYQSEIFQIDGFDEDRYLKIEYNTNENDGIVYNNNQTFIIRVEGRLVEYDPGQNKETYTNYNESLVNLNSYPKRGVKMEYGPLSRYMIEKLNLALAHEVFKINDVEYQSDGEAESDLVKDGEYVTDIYKGSTKLQQVEYEDYTTIADEEPEDTFFILIDDNNNQLIFLDQSVEFNAIYKD